jgi:hypothetical protein
MLRRMGILTAFSRSAGCRFSEDFLRNAEHFVEKSRLKEQTGMPELPSGCGHEVTLHENDDVS